MFAGLAVARVFLEADVLLRRSLVLVPEVGSAVLAVVFVLAAVLAVVFVLAVVLAVARAAAVT